MRRVGVRQLKEQASEIVRAVRQDGESFEITYHGEPVARLLPIVDTAPNERLVDFMRRWDEMGAEISANWSKDVPAAGTVGEQKPAV